MLKQTVTFEDYNGDTQTETLYFNLTKTEMMDMLELQPQLEAWSSKTSGPDRQMTREEITDFLNIVKDLIKRSYGVRSADGKAFRKNPILFEEFEQSAIYDAFVFDLFTNPEKASSFMTGILPQGLLEQAMGKSTDSTVAELPAEPEDNRPAWIKEDREPTKEELIHMTQDEMRQAFARRMRNT